MITYKMISREKIAVFIEKARVGTINKVSNGWQYQTIKGGFKGEIFPTLEELRKSLEEE